MFSSIFRYSFQSLLWEERRSSAFCWKHFGRCWCFLLTSQLKKAALICSETHFLSKASCNKLLSPTRERMNLKAPIYFSTGLTEKANHYYKLFITWTNQKIRKTFVQRNMFEFKHIKAFDRSYADNPGPMASFRPSLLTREKVTLLTFTMLCIFRWCLPHLACCTPASLCRSSRNGQGMKRTW